MNAERDVVLNSYLKIDYFSNLIIDFNSGTTFRPGSRSGSGWNIVFPNENHRRIHHQCKKT